MRLRELVAGATTGPWPWIRPWGAFTVHAIGNDDVLAEQGNLDLAVAAVNALPDLLDERDALRAAVTELLAANENGRTAAQEAMDEHGSAAAAHMAGPLPAMEAASDRLMAAEEAARAVLARYESGR